MKASLNHAIKELRGYSHGKIFTMESIRYWVEEHRSKYEYTNRYLSQDGATAGLKELLTLYSEAEQFRRLYRALDQLCFLFSYEPYLEQEVKRYDSMNGNVDLIREWVLRNEVLGSDTFSQFFYDYTDTEFCYDNPKHDLYVGTGSFGQFDIMVARKEFMYAIKFIRIFNKWYYRKNILEKVWPTKEEIEAEHGYIP